MNETETQKYMESHLSRRGLDYITPADYQWPSRIPDLAYIDGGELVVCEIKGNIVSSLDRGYLQAFEYKGFADRVFLVVPEDMNERVNYSALDNLGVGLILVTPDHFEIRLKAEQCSPNLEQRASIAAAVQKKASNLENSVKSVKFSSREYIEQKIQRSECFTAEEVVEVCNVGESYVLGQIREYALRGQVKCVGRTLHPRGSTLRSKLGSKWYGSPDCSDLKDSFMFPAESLAHYCKTVVENSEAAETTRSVHKQIDSDFPDVFSVDEVRRSLGYAVNRGWLMKTRGQLPTTGKSGNFYLTPDRKEIVKSIDPENRICEFLRTNAPASIPEIANGIGYTPQGTTAAVDNMLRDGSIVPEGERSGATVYALPEQHIEGIETFLSRFQEAILTRADGWRALGDLYQALLDSTAYDYAYTSFRNNVQTLESEGYVKSEVIGREKQISRSKKGNWYLDILDRFNLDN